MILKDYHTHTTFCDGKSTAEEMVLSAIQKGVNTIGFSGHSYTEFDVDYCMSRETQKKYIAEVHRLKEKYSDKINILCGIELDAFSDIDTSPFDYVIGSAHYMKLGEEYVPVDSRGDILTSAAEKYFGGDIYKLTEAYYNTVLLLLDKKVDIIGHLDLITKFNENYCMFDETDPRYIKQAENAVNKLITLGKPFEINTGVIVRGYKSTPYPAPFILDKITSLGGKVLLNSDSHHADMLAFEFDKWRAFADTHNVIWYE